MVLSRHRNQIRKLALTMKMSDRIRYLREKANMTQEELGAIIGVQKSAIRKYEKGEVENIKRSSIEKMADAFNVSPSYLMGWDDKTQPSESPQGYSLLTDSIRQYYGDEAVTMLPLFAQLNSDGKDKIINILKDLNELPKYTENNGFDKNTSANDNDTDIIPTK